MSDDVLSIIPTDPRWQPDRASAEQAAALVRDLAVDQADDLDITWHDSVAPVDCGENLSRIGCPHCGASIDTEWYADLLGQHDEGGPVTLAVEVPCCGAATSLDALDYDWPCGFARFEIALWNPGRDSFSTEELAAVAAALGHPVKQVRARL